MKLTQVDVRFYKSFNYDYELKARQGAVREEWEDQDGPWFPFVRVPIDRDITAIVGANESGKSHLLGAIKAALGQEEIDRADFCRYSVQYSVQVDQLRFPEFGAWVELERDEAPIGPPVLDDVKTFGLFRPGVEPPFLVIAGKRVPLDPADLAVVESRLPRVFEMKTDLAIPDSVSIRRLAGAARPALARAARSELLDGIERSEKTEAAFGSLLGSLLTPSGSRDRRTLAEEDAEHELARKLLQVAARIAPASFAELQRGIASGREGYVEGLVGRMNAAIKENVNVQRWWTQDKEFDLLLEAREHELALTIQDRTAATYSFKERSQGLRFFLSYFVQLMAHRLAGKGEDILLLDEPDAYLSSVGQQDLLRILLDYALPETGDRGGQVVYVTHSPFLVDKNAPQRIRVLDKGADEDGTRVVRDAANNRYEPLRSSLGVYVAETAFIGGQNLFVEGLGDQVLLAGLSTHVANREGSTATVMDLNKVTIVGGGGADGVPYMVYLARGRDTLKPACVALLDGDEAGRRAEKVLQRGEARRKRVLPDEYIVRIDTWAARVGVLTDWSTSPLEIEDLVPVDVARRATLNHIARFVDLTESAVLGFSSERVLKAASDAGSMWEGLAACVAEFFPDEHIEKAGFAREVVKFVDLAPEADGVDELRRRFSLLLSELAQLLSDASDEEVGERSKDQFARHLQGFLQDYTTGIGKFEAGRLLRRLELATPDNSHSDAVRTRLLEIRRDFEVDDRRFPVVPRFAEFRTEVLALGQLDRLAFQDDTKIDPSAAFSSDAAEPARSEDGALVEAELQSASVTSTVPRVKRGKGVP